MADKMQTRFDNHKMQDTSSNNKRIAKNTLLLYVRMFFIMAVTLYTSRVVLSSLGVEDFGIYNVVGGVVAMMGVLNGAMAVASQRYLTFELGRGNAVRLKQVFSMCFTIFVLLSVIVAVLGETIGIWFLNTQMILPEGRITAANWVFQFSMLTCIASLVVTPYNAVIIAHERMNVYAYVSIFEVVLNLAVVYLLQIIPVDSLAAYGFLILISKVVVMGTYIIYCMRHFRESHYSFYWEKPLFLELVSYSGWNLFGSVAGLVKGQGLNILLSMFFNPAVNAARGIAYQINVAVTQFFTNFYTAVRPQITKYYAQGNMEEMTRLVFRSSKMSFYLIMFVSMPIIIETPYIVDLWLGQLPEYVVPFIRLIIAISAIDSMASPLMTVVHATGHIKLYQSLVGTMTMLNIPVSYVFLEFGFSPLVVFYVSLFISVLCLFMRLWVVRRLMSFPVLEYVVKVFCTSVLVCALALVVPLSIFLLVDENIYSVILVCALCIVSSVISIYYAGLNQHERDFVICTVRNKILHRQ